LYTNLFQVDFCAGQVEFAKHIAFRYKSKQLLQQTKRLFGTFHG
jgi:hypothetical protein